MKKSKHFRKDVIVARVIAGVALIIVLSLLIWGISLLAKPNETDKDSQNTQQTQDTQDTPDVQDTQDSFLEQQGTENVEDTQESTEGESTEEGEPVVENKLYVKTTTQVKLRAEANTSCATLDRINGGTTLEVLEVLDGWYKVTYDGKEGYVSATYAKLVEEE